MCDKKWRGTDIASVFSASPNAFLPNTSISPRLKREHQLLSSWESYFGEIQNTRIKKSTLLYVVMSMGLSVYLYGLFNSFFTASSIFWNWKPLTTSSMRACILSLQRLPMEPSWVWWMFLLGVKWPASMSSPTFL